MNRFLKYTILFGLIIVLMMSGVSYITDFGLKKSDYGNMREWNSIFSGKIKADVVIQGNSRAWTGYNTFILDSVLHLNSYNLGIDGCPFDIQYARYKVYIQNNPAPKIIIQNIDHITMSRNNSIFDKYQFLPYLNNRFLKEQLHENGMPLTDFYFPFVKYAGQYKIIKIGFQEFFNIKHYTSKKYKGFKGGDLPYDSTNFEMIKRTEKTIKWKINKDVEKLFFDFLNDCAERRIKVILVYSPIYYQAVEITENRTELINYYENIAKLYKLSFFDYSLDSMSYNKEYFYNTAHINAKGAEIFTTKLANDVKK